MKSNTSNFITKWLVCSLGLFIAAGLLGSSVTMQNKVSGSIIAGLLLTLINIFLRPILVILSFPAIVLSLGLFMIIVNGFTVYLVSIIYNPFNITNFWSAIFAGMVVGLVNYLVLTILESRKTA